MLFKKEDLQALAWEDHTDDFEIIENEVVDTSRWSVIYDLIFKYKDKFYKTGYSVGATESQDESAFEYEPDEIECMEVFPVQETITVFKNQKQLDKNKAA